MKKTILDFYKMKQNKEKVVWVTAYDYCFAKYAEEAQVDIILVGDSLAMVVDGFDGTVPATMDQSIRHCQAVKRGAPNTYILGDMPFGSYHASDEDAVNNAVRFIKEAGVDAIKLEGGVSIAEKIKAISQAGIVVFAHLGLTPQSSAAFGGLNPQGKTTDSAKAIIEDAIAVYKAGAKTVLLENVPEEVCSFIHKILPIPVYAIGAGSDADGQVMVNTDILGMMDLLPSASKKYCNIAKIATDAIAQYVKESKEGLFPGLEQKVSIAGDKSEFDALFNEIEKNFIKE